MLPMLVETLAMAKSALTSSSFRLTPEARRKLADMAARAGQSQATFLEGLVHKAAADPDGYYLRTAAMQSFVAAALAKFCMELITGDEPEPTRQRERILARITRETIGLFGPLPAPPPAAKGVEAQNEVVRALFDAYGVDRPYD